MSKFTPWRTYSIFISSTFADMQAERDHLKNIVLPKIKEELRKKRIKLEIVDLRWGLDTTSIEQEDEREVTVLKVCLDEIKRCKPFFICLMGDRYGWIPPEKRMDDATTGMDHISHHKGKSVTALEIEYGVLASQEQLVRSVFYFRDTLDYTKFTPEKAAMFSDAHNPVLTEKEKKERGKALEKLKTSITSHFDNKEIKNKVKSYTVNWDAQKEKVINLEAWGEMLFEDIINDCIAHAKYTKASAPKNWQEKELALLDSFIENHTTTFCGREKLLKELKDHLLLKDPNNWGLILTGESGSGKSAVFSMVHKIMRQEDCLILSHSAGLSAKSRNILDLLQIWNKQLSDFLGIEYIELKPQAKTATPDSLQTDNERIQQAEPKPEIEKIQEKFKELLFTAAEQTQVVLLIDALDRFEPTQRAHYMTWLPTVMSKNVRMLCTAITGTEKKAVEYHSELLVSSIDFFTSEEAKLMLNMLCSLQHKSIPLNVEKVILEKKRDDGLNAISSPLWLSLAVNILMAMDNDDFEKMQQLEGRGDEVIVNYMEALVNDFPALPGKLFLSLLTKAASVFGEDFTWKTFNYIACSRDGLRESDLEKLIPKSKDENWDALLFANLRRWFNRHLREEGENAQWNLVHSILRNSLLEEKDKKTLKGIHNSIASHLLTLAADDELRISETMYHLMEAENAEKALDYYISELTDEELNGATSVLAEAISTNERGLNWCLDLLETAKSDNNQLWAIAPRFIYDLNYTLSVDGNLERRMQILERLNILLINTGVDYIENNKYGFDLGALFEKLGMIYQILGNTDNAKTCFHNYNNIFNQLNNNNPGDENLKKGFAFSFQYLGSIYQLLNEHDQALSLFLEFYKIQTELHQHYPENKEHKYNFVISCEKIGEYYQAQGNYNKALKYFMEEYNPALDLYDSDPQNENYIIGVAILSLKLGEIYEQRNDDEQAFTFYRTFHKLANDIQRRYPKDDSYKSMLAVSYEKIGGVFQRNKQLDKAKDYFIERNRLAKELCEDDTHNENFKDGLAISYQRLGIVYHELNELLPAKQCFVEFNDLCRELYETNPLEKYKYNLAISNARLGEIYRALDNIQPELEVYKEYKRIITELYESSPQNEDYLLGWINSYAFIGKVYKDLNKLNEALAYFIDYNSLTKELYDSNQDDEYFKEHYFDSFIDLGDIYEELGKLDDANQCFYVRIIRLKELIESDSNNYNLFAELASYYFKIGLNYKKLTRFDESKENLMQTVFYFEQLYKVTKEQKYEQYCNQVRNVIEQLENTGY